MWLLLLPSCRSLQCSQPCLPLFVSSATFYMLNDVSCYYWCSLGFHFSPQLCICVCFKSPVQQPVLSPESYFQRSCIDMFIALSYEGVMNRWCCVVLVCWQRQRQELWIASVSTVLFGWWSEHIVWQIGKGKYGRQRGLRDEAAGGDGLLFLFWDWWQHAYKEMKWRWNLSVSGSPWSYNFPHRMCFIIFLHGVHPTNTHTGPTPPSHTGCIMHTETNTVSKVHSDTVSHAITRLSGSFSQSVSSSRC